MIKATELRIGNWIKRDENEYEQVDGQFLSYDMTMSGITDVEGVDLTPEILEKAGFKNIEANAWKKGVLLLTKHEADWEEGFITLVGDDTILSNTLYVHQLQNLIFALSGEELTITL